MFRETVSSAFIVTVGYDEDSGILEVELSSGVVYRYIGVCPDVYEDFRAARSAGRFFNEHIRDCYPWEVVER